MCSKCWDASCPKSLDINKNCRRQPVTTLVANLDGSFTGLDFLSPTGMRLRDGNVAALAGTTPASVLVVLTAAEAKFDDVTKLATAKVADLPDLLSLCTKRKELLAGESRCLTAMG